jgi:ribosomal protein L11 methyltransferase
MPWLALTFEIDAAHAEAFGDALIESGADSVALEDADAGSAAEVPHYAEPSPHAAYGEFAPERTPAAWPHNRLSALIAEDTDPAALAAAAARAAGLPGVPRYTVARVADDDWVRRTQAQFAPLEIADRLWIVPSWHEPPEADAIAIRLDPGLAFGTGSHPTTRLALRFLARSLRDDRPGAALRVLDYGCGSGILAIAAAKLGAAEVDAVDVDPQAIAAAARNALANNVKLRACAPESLPPGEYDLVVANILANPLIVLAPLLVARLRPRARLALSGILAAQAAEVIAAYAPQVPLGVTEEEDGWVLLEGECREQTGSMRDSTRGAGA